MLGIEKLFKKGERQLEPAVRRRVEDELKKSYEFTRAILDSINDPISILDVNTFEIVEANATFIRMVGKSLAELVGNPCYQAIHGRSEICAGPEQVCPLLEMRETGKYAAAEHIRYRNGKMKIAEVSASPIRDENGTIVRVVHVAHDITDRKLAEEAVRKNEEHLQNILDSVRAGIVLADPAKHEIIYVNPYAAELIGAPKEQIIGRQCHDFICEAERGHCPIVEEHVKVENYERNLVRVNGESVPVLESVVPISYEGRELFIESFIDISGLKKTEEALRESEARYRDLFENANDLIQSVRFSDGTFLYVNRAWREAMGYSEEEMAQLRMFDVIAPECGAHCGETFARVRQGERVDSVEAVFVTKDGRNITVEGSVNCNFVDGKPFATRGIFRDITERKQHQEKLQLYADELQLINEEMRNFAYIVSHDLRAPLVSIKGFSSELQGSVREMQPLLDKCTAALDEKERKQLDLILQEDIGEAIGFIGASVNRMDGLINNILNLSRLGRKELNPEPLNMTEITSAILASLAHQIEQKRVTVTLAELPEVVADRVAMEQIMGNLLDNALKYLEPGRAGELTITAEKRADEVTFLVRDNGRGIAQEDMHKVFELFRRAGKQDTKGEGMGLAYVKTLVRRHGGRIWCESEPGVGSTFSFNIAK